MAKSSSLDLLKNIIADMVDKNGNIRVRPIGALGKRELSNGTLNFLTNLIMFLRDTSFFTDDTKMYIFNKYITISGVNEAFNGGIIDDTIKLTTTIGRIYYDKNKFEKVFGSSMLVDVLIDTSIISKYESILLKQFIKYSSSNELRKNVIGLNIPKDVINMSLSDDKFEKLLDTIEPYTKPVIDKVNASLDQEIWGYFNYLMSIPKLDGIDRQRQSRLYNILSGESK